MANRSVLIWLKRGKKDLAIDEVASPFLLESLPVCMVDLFELPDDIGFLFHDPPNFVGAVDLAEHLFAMGGFLQRVPELPWIQALEDSDQEILSGDG